MAFAHSVKISAGDTAWVLVSALLVIMMTIPGLAIFYAGLSKKKDTLNTIALSFVAFAITSIIWVTYGYSLAFGQDVNGLIGNLNYLFMNNITINTVRAGTDVPEYAFVSFQLAFAAITVALISGALIERLKFRAWLLVIPTWATLVYIPIAHWVWDNGFLAKMGVVDFAGGNPVEIASGFSALAGALAIRKRKNMALIPHNMVLVMLGLGLLWFGWFGFNAGSELAANGVASVAFLNTNTAATSGLVMWMIIEVFHSQKATNLGMASGALAGLVAITPAAGYVGVMGSIFIGLIASIVSYMGVVVLKPRFGYDDTLDVFGIHGLSGFVGTILTGIFAQKEINQVSGLLQGNIHQFLIQTVSAIITSVYAFGMSFIIFKAIDLIVGLRVTPEQETEGLDAVFHGENAYNF
ncbi:ammonium transporter [Hydrogenobaculum acidophilum]